MPRAVLPPLPVLVALLLAGCGGGTPEPKDHAAVRDVLVRFDAAQAAGDARTTCNRIVAVEEQGRIEVPGREGPDREGDADAAGSACERALTRAAASRRALGDVKLDISSISVEGDRASARVRTRLTRPDGSRLDQAGVRRLARVDGTWRLLLTEE